MTIFVRMPNKGLYLNEYFKTLLRPEYDPTKDYGEVLISWGCNMPTGKNKVLNNGEAFRLTANKPAFRLAVSKANVRIPATYTSESAALSALKSGVAKLIGRPANHHGGQNLFEVTDEDSLKVSVAGGAVYWTEYLPKDREIRVFVAMGRVWTVSEKILPPEQRGQIAWNWEQGGKFDIVRWSKWPTKACAYALMSSYATGLAFGSYDLIHYNGKWWMLEGNSSTQILGDYKINRLRDVIEYHEKNGFDWFDPFPYGSDFHDFIHPALRDDDAD